MLKEGTQAPEFEAEMGDGTPFRLADYRGKKHVVLYFYPKDFTPGCTREACSFRDNYDEVEKYDAIIVGVSNDSGESHERFKEQHSLPFPLVPDPDKKLTSLYGIGSAFLGFAQARVTYVIDKEGTIRHAIRHDLDIGAHLTDVLRALESLEGAPA